MQTNDSITQEVSIDRESVSWWVQDTNARLLIAVLILIYIGVLIRTAWVSDDAYITFRTVDNFVNGFGLRWNIAERVQSYTHPLWMFIVAFFYLLTGEFFFTSIFLSITISVATVLILVRGLARTGPSACLAILVLILSKAFIDYSTSGLENPLTHLILVLFIFIYLRFERSLRTLMLLSLVASLGAVTRLDTVLLYLPGLVYYVVLMRSWQALRVIIVGMIPLLLWEAFSFFYYGFFVPNTAYAKLGAGIPRGESIQQGLLYLLNSLSLDPLTLFAIISAAMIAFYQKKNETVSPVGRICTLPGLHRLRRRRFHEWTVSHSLPPDSGSLSFAIRNRQDAEWNSGRDRRCPFGRFEFFLLSGFQQR